MLLLLLLQLLLQQLLSLLLLLLLQLFSSSPSRFSVVPYRVVLSAGALEPPLERRKRVYVLRIPAKQRNHHEKKKKKNNSGEDAKRGNTRTRSRVRAFRRYCLSLARDAARGAASP